MISSASDVKAAVLIACGGSGARFQTDMTQDASGMAHMGKQFMIIAGKPVIAHTLDTIEHNPRLDFAVLILPEKDLEIGGLLVSGAWPEKGANRSIYHKVKHIIAGGDSRQESVAAGLRALDGIGWEGPVLVQDGVRPCTSASVYDRVLDGVIAKGNAVAAIPLRDTIKRADEDGAVIETLPREGLWQIQTPQGFWMSDLLEAYNEGHRQGLTVTDDAALMEALGRPVYLVDGDPVNIKLTYKEDIDLLEAILR